MTRATMRFLPAAALLGAAPLVLSGCNDRPLAAPVPNVVGQSNWNTLGTQDVDVLFMIDDSPSMSPKQQALASQFANFLTPLENAGASYHVGIVTSNLGAWPASGSLSGMLGGKCDTITGDNGMLQATPCLSRPSSDFSAANVQSICNGICPTAVQPMAMMLGKDMVTANFIASTGGSSPMTNVPGNDVAHAFACLAFVGDTGCGIEMQLEAMKRAVDGTAGATNAGFLRSDALLALVMITDEDDCSVQNRMSNDPMTADCSPGGKDPDHWYCYNPDYRCFAEGTKCSQALDQTGTKMSCVSRPMNNPSDPDLYLYDVSSYTKFFDTLKPGQVLAYGIVSPAAQTGGPVVIEQNEGSGTPGLNRPSGTAADGDAMNAACNSGIVDPITGNTIIGKPQTRLHDFITHFGGIEYSVCNVNGYANVLNDIANHIQAALGSACMGPLPTPGTSTTLAPADMCNVVEASGGKTLQAIPECNLDCCNAFAMTDDMNSASALSACGSDGTPQPCWCAVGSAASPAVKCTTSQPTAGGIFWGGHPATGNVQTHFSCQVKF